MTNAIVDIVHVSADTKIQAGSKLFDVTIDLSDAAPHDCPPVSSYRLVSREAAWLRQVNLVPGDVPGTGALLALLSTEPDEPLDGTPERELRYTIAGIFKQQNWPDFDA